MGDFQIILENSAFDKKKVRIKTKERGIITGVFTGVDEYDTDPERYGFYIDTSEYEYDTVFIDEIIDIEVPEKSEKSPYKLKLASGK